MVVPLVSTRNASGLTVGDHIAVVCSAIFMNADQGNVALYVSKVPSGTKRTLLFVPPMNTVCVIDMGVSQ